MALSLVAYHDLRYDQRHRSPVIFLKDTDNEKYLPVWIGELEASSIEQAVIHKSPARPLTHDLFMTVLRELEVKVDRVVIDRLENGTYYATLYLMSNGQYLKIDSRPSDAIALALREKASIYVDEDLMYSVKFVELRDNPEEDESGEIFSDQPPQEVPEDQNVFQDFLKRISPSDFKDN